MSRPPRPLHQRSAVASAVLAFAWLFPGTVGATPSCNASSEPHTNLNQFKEFQVNTSGYSSFPGWTTDELRAAAVAGSSLINDQGNAGWFRYVGDTNLTYNNVKNWTETYCNSNNIKSIIHFRSGCETYAAYTYAICGGTRFFVDVVTEELHPPSTCTQNGYSYGNGTVGTVDLNMVATIAHELTHSQGIGHPSHGEGATVGFTGALGRQLFQYDLECTAGSSGLSGYRSEDAIKRSLTSSGSTVSMGSASVVKSGVAKTAAGWTDVSGGWAWCSTYHGSTGAQWDLNANGSSTALSSDEAEAGVGYASGTFREIADSERVFFSSFIDDAGQSNWSSKHDVKLIRSTTDYASESFSTMQRCTSMTGAMACTAPNRTDIESASRLAVAYLGDIGESVVVWAQQDRGNWGTNATSERISIAVGSVTGTDGTVLPVPTTPGERTSIPPGLACMENSIGSYDCIVVFVANDDDLYEMKARRFSVTYSSPANRYTLTFDSSTYTLPGNTANGVAVWYMTSSSKIYVAYRETASGQRLRVLSSTDGTTWATAWDDLGEIIGGPSIASMWRGDTNTLMYMR